MEKELRIKTLEKLKEDKKPYKHDDIVYRNTKRLLPVYEIPLDSLVYNKYNGRILSRVKSFERQFRKLDPTLPADKKIIEEFLWQSKEDRNKTTLADLKKYGQKKIGIVTKDGIIIDGNRRASLLNRIRKEESAGPMYFLAVILDDTLEDNPQEIMRMETMYQMGEDEKLDYNPIEKYLKCKDLVQIGFTTSDIANMMGEQETRVTEWLSIMKLMDSYLSHLGYDGIYTRLEKREGQFVDLNRYLKKYENGTSMVDWPYQLSDISDLKAICFDHIRAQYEGKEFRAIALPSKKESFFCKKKVWEKFKERHFETIDAINSKEASVDELRKKEPEGDLSAILKVRDEDWTASTEVFLKHNLNQTQRILDDVNEESAPLELLKRAKDTLNSIDPGLSSFYNDKQVATMVTDIDGLLSKFKDIIKRMNK